MCNDVLTNKQGGKKMAKKYNIEVQVINNYEVIADSEEQAIEIYSTSDLEVSDYKILDDIKVSILEEKY
jgi:hypothetical protein